MRTNAVCATIVAVAVIAAVCAVCFVTKTAWPILALPFIRFDLPETVIINEAIRKEEPEEEMAKTEE